MADGKTSGASLSPVDLRGHIRRCRLQGFECGGIIRARFRANPKRQLAIGRRFFRIRLLPRWGSCHERRAEACTNAIQGRVFHVLTVPSASRSRCRRGSALLRSLVLFCSILLTSLAIGQDETPVEELEHEGALPSAEATDVELAEVENVELTWQEEFDAWFGANILPPIASVLFFEVGLDPVQTEDGHTLIRSAPLIVVVLFFGGILFTFRYGFVNVRLFRHSISVVRGVYTDPEAQGEVSHFKALTSALSATVGLGNIAGVAVAITLGGPGAVFWMWFAAFFGMSLKFSSCTFAQLHRHIHPDGRVLGGPMIYLDRGLRDTVIAPLAKVFAVVFAVLATFAAFGGGNMFQINQTASIIVMQFFPGTQQEALIRLVIGLSVAALAGVVIIGGIRRIGNITSTMVPLMCAFYCTVCIIIIGLNYQNVPSMFAEIFSGAFSAEAIYGGFIGVLVQGVRRAAFSNEAGVGSSAIAHAAARTKEPVREGLAAMLEPFIDTIVVCTMTALAILITDSHMDPSLEGVQITSLAFAQLGAWLPYVLSFAVFIFAFSTLISWGYYGERAIEYLAGPRGILPYRFVYVAVIVIGPLLSLQSVIDFSDMMLLSMAFPNIIGQMFMWGKVKALTDDYTARLKAGEIKPYAERVAAEQA